tara:strand:+ start:481 stop:624 length:144 start_codon:yes stop_codon:yes gene_type:complete
MSKEAIKKCKCGVYDKPIWVFEWNEKLNKYKAKNIGKKKEAKLGFTK